MGTRVVFVYENQGFCVERKHTTNGDNLSLHILVGLMGIWIVVSFSMESKPSLNIPMLTRYNVSNLVMLFLIVDLRSKMPCEYWCGIFEEYSKESVNYIICARIQYMYFNSNIPLGFGKK